MSAYDIACDMFAGILGYFGVPKTTVQITTALPAHDTPYVWARDFLEESGFNLTERVPAILGVYQIPGATYYHDFNATRVVSAVPPYLVHELSLHWVIILITNICQLVVNTIGQLDMLDLAWLLLLLSIATTFYLWRSRAIPTLLRA